MVEIFISATTYNSHKHFNIFCSIALAIVNIKLWQIVFSFYILLHELLCDGDGDVGMWRVMKEIGSSTNGRVMANGEAAMVMSML